MGRWLAYAPGRGSVRLSHRAPADRDGGCHGDKDVIADRQVELVEVASGELHVGVGPVVEMDLDADLEAELGDPFDHARPGAVDGAVVMTRSCGRTQSPSWQRRRTEEGRDELVGRVVVALGRRADLLEACRRG